MTYLCWGGVGVALSCALVADRLREINRRGVEDQRVQAVADPHGHGSITDALDRDALERQLEEIRSLPETIER
jgi:hypothetical protein